VPAEDVLSESADEEKAASNNVSVPFYLGTLFRTSNSAVKWLALEDLRD